MSNSRRRFVRQAGSAIAALAASSCLPPTPTCYAPLPPSGPSVPTRTPTPSRTEAATPVPMGAAARRSRPRARGCSALDPALRADRIEQEAALAEMAARSGIEPGTVARARAALERDQEENDALSKE